MTKRDLAMLISRVLALVSVLFGMPHIVSSIISLSYSLRELSQAKVSLNFLINNFASSFIPLFFIGGAFLLWFYAERVAFLLTRGLSESNSASPKGTLEWLAIAVAVVGLYFIGNCGSHIEYFIIFFPRNSQDGWYRNLLIILLLFKLFFGLFLVFRCRTVAAWVLSKDGIYPISEGRE